MRPNIILIVCDTLRKDIMHLYGGPASMPNVETFSKDSMVYENCIAPSTWTFPSHVSMFTGMYPSEHGIHETDRVKAGELRDALKKLSAPRLPEQLESRGYNTICVSNNFMINKHSGFDYGFRTFITLESSPWSQSRLVWKALELGRDPVQILMKLMSMGRLWDIAKYAAEFMRIQAAAKMTNYPLNKGARRTVDMLAGMELKNSFFLFINFWEMHEPYRGFSDKELLEHLAGIQKLSDAKVESLKLEYIREAAFLDEQLGRLFGMLKRKGLYDSSMIILTSDHGQEFNEHGYMYHGSQLHDEITRVPLIIKYPGSKKFRKRAGYQSPVNLPRLIESVIEGGDDRSITTRNAFSESYANVEFIPKSMRHVKKAIEKKYDKVLKAVYMDGYKLTLNGSDGVVEEFTKDGKRASIGANAKIFRELVKQIEKFKGRERFLPPKP